MIGHSESGPREDDVIVRLVRDVMVVVESNSRERIDFPSVYDFIPLHVSAGRIMSE